MTVKIKKTTIDKLKHLNNFSYVSLATNDTVIKATSWKDEK